MMNNVGFAKENPVHMDNFIEMD